MNIVYLKNTLKRFANVVRPLPAKTVFLHELLFSFSIACGGVLLGILSKGFDGVSIIGDVTTEIGVWIFLASIIALISHNPISSAINTILFFLAMLAAYYLYGHFVLGFFPQAYFRMWLLAASLTPFGGFLLWFAHGNGWFSAVVAALPISVLLAHGYPVWYTHKVTLFMDIVFAVVLVFVLPTTSKQRLYASLFSLPIAVAFYFLRRSGLIPIFF
jgi:hypothetical protein